MKIVNVIYINNTAKIPDLQISIQKEEVFHIIRKYFDSLGVE